MIAMKSQVIKHKMMKLAGAVITCAVLAACSNSDVSTPPLNTGTASAGDADFTKFVSVGDSLTAGYADGTLYLLGQKNSFPAILAQQFADVGGGTFEQPLTNDNLGGLILFGSPILDPVTSVNLFDNRFVLNTETEMPERLVGDSTNEVYGSGLNGTAFNNMGVPAAKSFHLITPGYGDVANLATGKANPYYVRFATASDARIIDDAGVQAPSFYTLWVGANDVIWYGFAGGDDATATDQTGNIDASTYRLNDISDPAVVKLAVAAIVTRFKNENPDVKGVLINVPDVTTIPYFTTVPYNPVPLDQATADALNAAYAPYNAGIAQALAANPDEVAQRTITFVEGQNAVVILDEDLTDLSGAGLPSMRQATADDLIPLEVAPVIGTLADPMNPNSALGVGVPLEDKYVLIPSEIQAMKTAIAAYNTAIQNVVDQNTNLILLDANAMFHELTANGGIDYGNGSVNADFATGGFFSLDGIHPTARGYAVLSNKIIDAINAGFNANVYKVDAGSYPTVFLK
jgi:lysophospholipase L1-like esterase